MDNAFMYAHIIAIVSQRNVELVPTLFTDATSDVTETQGNQCCLGIVANSSIDCVSSFQKSWFKTFSFVIRKMDCFSTVCSERNTVEAGIKYNTVKTEKHRIN
jgi:hypothetical protein